MKNIKPTLLAVAVIGLLAGCMSTSVDVGSVQQTLVEENCVGSFWNDCVQYPFEVKYHHVADDQGTQWQVAFMDEYRGSEDNPPVVVLIHGKGMFAGYLSQLMQDLLAEGYRVVAPDLPNYGKSIPGNLANPVTRSLDDTREVIHRLLTEKLTIERASFFGHSMGGQWAVGYALRYPNNVEKLVLEAPGGMEEFPTSVAGISYFGDQQAADYQQWLNVWSPIVQTELGKTAQDIELFNYFKRKDPASGKIVAANSGYFLRENAQSQYITAVRTQMIDTSPSEYKRYAETYIRDIYSMGVEVRKEDANSLVKRLGKLEVPTFISYGEKEPFIPTTIFSGNQGLRWSVIKPIYDKMSENGNPPLVKVYQDAAHFIHVDQAERFSVDMINFLNDGQIYSGHENVAQYKAPKVKLPQELQTFFDDFKAALLSQDKQDIAGYYAEDFLENGFDKQQFLTVLYSQLKHVKDYKVSLMRFDKDEQNPQEYFLDGKVNLGAITVPFKPGSKIRKTTKGWEWLGNQQ